MTFGAKIPGWLDKIQFITFWAMNPCEIPFIAYIETAQPITHEITLVFLNLDLQAFLRQLFRPKWMRSYRHTRKGRRGRPALRGVPEPGELIADILDPDHRLRPKRWFLGFRLLLEWVDIQERIFWTIMLVEMADTLIINTIVGAIEANPDKCPGIARALLSVEHQVIGGIGTGDIVMGFDTINYAVGCKVPNGFRLDLEEGKYVIVFTGMIKGNRYDTFVEPYIMVVKGADYQEFYGDRLDLKPEQSGPYMATATIRGPAAIFWRMARGPGFFQNIDSRCFAIQISN